MEVWTDRFLLDDPKELTQMLKVVMEAAGERFGVWPLLLIVVAALALVTMIFVLRYRRKGEK